MIPIPGFQMLRQLGDGGAAYVYHAINPEQNRHVALKVLKPEHEGKPGVVKRFRDEARIAAKLKNDAVVTLYGSSTRQAPYWIEYEYLGGGTLRERLARGRLPLPEALRIFSAMCRALDSAHRQHVIHRDLKPGNILFDQENRPYLTDFGISKDLDQTGHTKYGAQLGTPAYMSPEQTWGHPTTRATDVWSLAVVLFEMLTGRLPFPGPDAVLVHQIRHDTPLRLAQFAQLPPAQAVALERVLTKALQKDPNQRYRSVGEFAAAVQEALPNRTTPTPPGVVTTPLPWLRIALVTVLLAVLAVAVWMWVGGGPVTSPPPPPPPPPHLRVPDVSGLTVQDATQKLAAFTVRTAPKPIPSDMPEGTVVRTDPAAGAEYTRGSPVQLLVSAGPRTAPTLTIPDVHGLSVEDARATLAAFTVNSHTTKPSDDVAKGRVIGTDPPAGTEVDPASEALTLVVSGGPAIPPVRVPTVRGLTIAQAEARLRSGGLQASSARQYRPDKQIAQGLVITTYPATGKRVAPGSWVTLYVSTGRQKTEVPSVVGWSVSDAKKALSDKGLGVAVRQEVSSSIPKDQVIRTDPAGGVRVEQGTTVTLVVSSGKPSGPTVPDVIMRSESWAQAALLGAGYKVRVERVPYSRGEPGIVLSTRPAPGTERARGETVVLVVSSKDEAGSTSSR